MRSVKVAAGVLNQTPLDWSGNSRRIREIIAAARAEGVGLLCLPEMAITGYGCEDAFHGAWLAEEAWTRLFDLARHTHGIAVSVGLPVRYRGAIYNCAALLVDGEVAGLVAKQHLAGDGIHYEPRWFKPWPAGKHGRIDDGPPIGDLYFDLGGVRVGFEICEDAWVASRPGASLASHALDILCNPSASHFAFRKLEVRRRLIQEGSRAFGVTYLYANLLGNESGRVIYDGGAIIASAGEIIATGPRLGMEEWALTTAIVDIELTRTAQARSASFVPQVDDVGPMCVRTAWTLPTVRWAPTPPLRPAAWETSPAIVEEEFTRAVTLALFDYLRKSRSKGYVVSLSGGADSAACAVLVRLMVDRALQEIGPEALAARTGIPVESADPAVWTRRLLTCVYQSTAQSSDTTRNAAQALAAAIGARWYVFDVEPMVRGYVGMVSRAIGRDLTWEADDIALQNIQARVRAPGAWMLANLGGALLLTTSNRSEAAVGYATMDGDTAGGLAPIAGVDKAFLRAWLRWLEHDGPLGLGPIPALHAINIQPPTAELRPSVACQTDEADLMPYPVLEAIEDAAIRDKRSPAECYEVLSRQFPEATRAERLRWIGRFFRLWSQNQWKRERFAPSFHLDDKSLDPKTWCRFPILSGGYAEELKALEETPE